MAALKTQPAYGPRKLKSGERKPTLGATNSAVPMKAPTKRRKPIPISFPLEALLRVGAMKAMVEGMTLAMRMIDRSLSKFKGAHLPS